MAKQVAKFTCRVCGTSYRSKLKRGKPIRGCPDCKKEDVVVSNTAST